MSMGIAFWSVWLLVTEIIYWVWGREDVYDFKDFMGAKTVSMVCGLAGGFLLVIMPWPLYIEYGVVIFYWFYGTLVSLVAIFGINWGLHNLIEYIIERIDKMKEAQKKSLRRKSK